MFINPKDAPFAVAMAVLLLGLVRAARGISEALVPTTLRSSALGFGLSIGSRIMARLRRHLSARRHRTDRRRSRPARTDCAPRGDAARHASAWRLAAGGDPRLRRHGAGLAVGRDRSAQSAARHRRVLARSSRSRGRSCSTACCSTPPDMPRSYVPELLGLQLPEIFSLLGIAGLSGMLIGALCVRAFRRGNAPSISRSRSPRCCRC